MAILKIGDGYINTDHITGYLYDPEDTSSQRIRVAYVGGGAETWEGEPAIALKRWLDKNSFDVMEE